MKPELLIPCKCTIGEGPVWDASSGKFYYVDVREWKLYCWNGQEIEDTIQFEKSLGFAIPRESGGFVAGLQDGFYFAAFGGEPPEYVASAEPGRTDGRFNDGKADPAGRVWGGTQTLNLDTGCGEVLPDSGLYCLGADRQVQRMQDGVIQGNGMGWSADTKKYYFIDTEKHCVQEFDYDLAQNRLANGRICVEIPKEEGLPDGMAVDDEGKIWVALWGGSCVNRYDPKTGRLLDQIELPVPNVTSCCFGGGNLDELYITTASILTDLTQYPSAGGVFRAKLNVRGRPSYKYKG